MTLIGRMCTCLFQTRKKPRGKQTDKLSYGGVQGIDSAKSNKKCKGHFFEDLVKVFDSNQAKNTGVLVKTKSVILQTN